MNEFQIRTLAMARIMIEAVSNRKVQYRTKGDPNATWADVDKPFWGWSIYEYRISPSQSEALGHNPFNLTDETVGDGFRLLDVDEIKMRSATPLIWKYDKRRSDWEQFSTGSVMTNCYRTRLSREDLAKLT